MYIRALDKDFPLCYTVEAQSEIAKKAGRLEDIEKLFDEENAAEVTENTTWMLAALMKAAANREKVKCRMLGEEYKGVEPPDYGTLRVILEPNELNEAMKEIFEAMGTGNETTTEVKENKGKNVEATQ